jgi:3-hydroxyisobutyrate dehydrogenase-like beta-hydroxyacid dehydrogenase
MDATLARAGLPKLRVGFIGLGLMGKPMAGHILRAGYPLTVHNRSQAAVDELVAQGAQAATAPREVAENSDVVITMLPDSPDVEAVINAPNGILAGARPGLIHVDMSTISATATRRIAAQEAEHGHSYRCARERRRRRREERHPDDHDRRRRIRRAGG